VIDVVEKQTVLIVDDEPEILESLSIIFKSRGFKVITATSGSEAMDMYSLEPTPVIVCDNSLPDIQGLELLHKFKEIVPEVQIIMVTGKGTIDIAVAAMKAGMFDFITKPVDPEYLVQLAKRAHQLYDALTVKKTLLEDVERMTEKYFVGRDPSMRNLLRLIYTVAPTDSTVLVEGESGTGKELVARLIHNKSQRSSGPFIAVDCGAIPDGLVESELFGHEKGAFTGASSMKLGKFERANKGTLFLDEITNLPVSSQVKLLRALQEKVIERVGGQRNIPVDMRLVAASNVDLKEAVSEKQFREDLFYRLNIVKIKIPPLRERTSDIPALSIHFVEKHKEKIKSIVTGISKEAMKALMEYSWPGNVRELENTIEHSLIMAGSSQIKLHDLPPLGYERKTPSRLDEAEKDLILKALKDAEGNKYRAAKILGIPRSSLYSKLKKLDIS
jgi:two-component system NtrC family response regulator